MDIKSLMEQAKKLQANVADAQGKLGEMTVKGISGNGLVIVEMTGKYDLQKLTLSPELLSEDLETVTALITSAFNDAKAKADAAIDKVMGQATAGMPLPL
ncbi:MAG: YbaB/EbfC family nucleoid-associated protein [Rickettsiales bacterium]|jgi:DNA-binding YbaB/EbfC family protein|nr:YbaB/EbfC family nucleoid-associated protein [Rickettsiales bacterium]